MDDMIKTDGMAAVSGIENNVSEEIWHAKYIGKEFIVCKYCVR